MRGCTHIMHGRREDGQGHSDKRRMRAGRGAREKTITGLIGISCLESENGIIVSMVLASQRRPWLGSIGWTASRLSIEAAEWSQVVLKTLFKG